MGVVTIVVVVVLTGLGVLEIVFWLPFDLGGVDGAAEGQTHVEGVVRSSKSKYWKLVLEISSSGKTWKADRQLVRIFLKAEWFLIYFPLFSIDTGWTIVAKLCKVRKKFVPEYHPHFSPQKKAKT